MVFCFVRLLSFSRGLLNLRFCGFTFHDGRRTSPTPNSGSHRVRFWGMASPIGRQGSIIAANDGGDDDDDDDNARLLCSLRFTLKYRVVRGASDDFEPRVLNI